MIRRILLFLVLCVVFSCAKEDAEVAFNGLESEFVGELVWVKNFGGSGNESAQAIIGTNDGGFAVLGYTGSIDGDIAAKFEEENDYWFLKFDANGVLQWNKTYGGSMDDIGQSLVQTTDGGYALTGYAMSSDGDATNNQGFHDNWILKLDAQGVLEWESSYGVTRWVLFYGFFRYSLGQGRRQY
mgnify:CR=1 FL=1